MAKLTVMDLVHMCSTMDNSWSSSGKAFTVSFEIVGHRALSNISLLSSLDSCLKVSKGVEGVFELLREATASTLVLPWLLVYKGTGSKEVSREVRRSTIIWYTGNADKWADARLRDST
jgi:hypothetical protein